MMMSNSRILKSAGMGFLFLSLVLFASHHFVSLHYERTRSNIIDVAAGATHYYKGAHGVVYLTTPEYVTVQGLWFATFAVILVSVVLQFLGRRSPNE
jgi:hypothetical protein